MTKGKSLQLVERDFKLQGRMNQEELFAGKAVLQEKVSAFLASDNVDPKDRLDLEALLQVLKKDTFSGNEAGAAAYSSFASTEIEEACRRIPYGEEKKYLLYRHRWHQRPQSFFAGDFPIHLGIESTSVCDLKCKMCFQTDPLFYKEKGNLGFMPFDLYTSIIDEGVENGLCSVKLSIRGEPLLHKELPRMIRYARAKGILDVMLNTNSNTLTQEKAREILAAEPTLVIFSIDSMNKKRFEDIRRGAKLETVVANVEQFLKIRRDEFPGILTKTRLQMTLLPEAEGDVEDLKVYWTGKMDQIAIKKVTTRMHNGPVLCSAPCRVLWQRMDIHWNGDVWMCDNDYIGKLKLGNIKERTIKEIWNGELLNSLRKKHSLGEKNDIDPCKFCDGL